MAANVPQRELRNNLATLLRRVEAGEQVRVTVDGLPVAELVPIDRAQPFVPFEEIVQGLRGTMLTDDRLEQEFEELDKPPRDAFS